MFLSASFDLTAGGGNTPDLARFRSRLGNAAAAGVDVVILGRDIGGAIAPGSLEALVALPWVAGAVRDAAIVGVLPALHGVPFHVARALSAADFLSGGRAGWMPVWQQHKRFDRAYGAGYRLGEDEAPAKYDDFIRATQALWDSWDDDALIIDKASGAYLDSGKVRRVHYRGSHFGTVGPLNAARPPQGYPLLFREWTQGMAAATTPADVLLIAAASAAEVSEVVDAATATGGYRPAVFLKAGDGVAVDAAIAIASEVGASGIHLSGDASVEEIRAVRARMPAAASTRSSWRERLGVPRPSNPYTQRGAA